MNSNFASGAWYVIPIGNGNLSLFTSEGIEVPCQTLMDLSNPANDLSSVKIECIVNVCKDKEEMNKTIEFYKKGTVNESRNS